MSRIDGNVGRSSAYENASRVDADAEGSTKVDTTEGAGLVADDVGDGQKKKDSYAISGIRIQQALLGMLAEDKTHVDTNRDGTVSKKELEYALDVNEDGKIDLKDLAVFNADDDKTITKDEYERAVKALDLDKTGFIGRRELREAGHRWAGGAHDTLMAAHPEYQTSKTFEAGYDMRDHGYLRDAWKGFQGAGHHLELAWKALSQPKRERFLAFKRLVAGQPNVDLVLKTGSTSTPLTEDNFAKLMESASGDGSSRIGISKPYYATSQAVREKLDSKAQGGNANGKLDTEEFNHAYDLDGDGSVYTSEMAFFDRDGDKLISAKEYQTTVAEFDRDRDGKVTASEVEKTYASYRDLLGASVFRAISADAEAATWNGASVKVWPRGSAKSVAGLLSKLSRESNQSKLAQGFRNGTRAQKLETLKRMLSGRTDVTIKFVTFQQGYMKGTPVERRIAIDSRTDRKVEPKTLTADNWARVLLAAARGEGNLVVVGGE